MNQIKVTITNLTNKELTLRWLAKGVKCLPAGSSIVVDYEPWSCLDAGRRSDMENYLKTNSIALQLHVMSVQGVQYDIDYNPFIKGADIVCQEQTKKTTAVLADNSNNGRKLEVDEKSHIVVTGSNNADDLGFKKSVVQPKGLDSRVEPRLGFVEDKDLRAKGVVINNDNAQYLLNKEAKKEEEPKAEERDYKAEFTELVNQKKWNEALELLIEQFGKERVTFSARTIMTIKDYDEIVSRKLS